MAADAGAHQHQRGKTWLGVHVAMCLATGRPFLGRFIVPEPRPVVYVALEGARPNLRARIGALAHGMELDPDGSELDFLDVQYKRLRAAAHVRESNERAGDFRRVLENTRLLGEAGCATLYAHHNVKQSADPEKRKANKRQAGERMSGSGALYGHADFGIFITEYNRRERVATVELATRDDAELGVMTVASSATGQVGSAASHMRIGAS